jgi:hypothetical protein
MAHLLSNHDMAKLVRAAGWRGARPPVAREDPAHLLIAMAKALATHRVTRHG